MSKPRTLAMYAEIFFLCQTNMIWKHIQNYLLPGIFVSNVQNPQLWAEWTIINEINGNDVNIASQGVGGRFVGPSVTVVVSVVCSMKAFSSGEIFLYSDGELLPNINQSIAQIPPDAPEK